MLKSILAVSFLLILYTYLIFPVLLFVMVRMIKNGAGRIAQRKRTYPSVAIVCAMYNEEKTALKKIQNFLDLKYDKLRLYIGSDGSSDRTNEILRQYSNEKKIVVFEFPRRGKVHVINDLIAKVNEEIVVFTDANSMFEPDAVTALVKHFDDPQVGVVCGKLELVSSGRATGEGFYWRYETAIKKWESKLNCVIGANGAIFAVYRRLLRPLPLNTINDDFTISMRIVEQGYGMTYAEDAVAYEELNNDDSVEFRRHVRDGAGHYRALTTLYRLLNPFRIKVFFLYVSHRVIRWFVPFLLIVLLIVPLFHLEDRLIRNFFSIELFFYSIVLIGWISKTRMKILYIPYYFVYINIALLLGFIKTISGLQNVMWNSTER